MKKALSIIGKIIKGILVVCILLFVVVVLLQRISNNTISIFGYRMFSVVTESMTPTYVVGDVLISKEVDANTIQKGDPITYLGKSGSVKGKVITHRVVDLIEQDGETYFLTKGDANDSADPLVAKDQVYGKVVYKTKALSFFYKLIMKPIGFVCCIVIPILILIGSEIVTTLVENYEEKRQRR